MVDAPPGVRGVADDDVVAVAVDEPVPVRLGDAVLETEDVSLLLGVSVALLEPDEDDDGVPVCDDDAVPVSDEEGVSV